ncbi:DEAD/DEAH box helicase [Jiulongibacter sediminis]|uniref:Helicase SNF2 n=1 Tax=Jiulongibacter sediminis TaxID=1605367 RepID=A0A0P7C461_9BACT|nr:DEAD/DEAH box helicase [Jiulongibacter sediminis]KPM47970.1 helicase SNF2 [Jiulongibacter sediminis]TBX24152.1 helicase SNF2 [Jiulongibacter sediminis]
MKVSTAEPFQIIYSLFEHQYLGYLFESYMVQLNAKEELTYAYQNVSSMNIKEFSKGIDEVDIELVKLMDAIQQDAILKKFNPKKLKPFDYFTKVYGEKPDLALQAAIEEYLNKYRASILPKLIGKRFFVMSNDGIPMGQEVNVLDEPAKVYLNFDRKEDHTIYFPVIKCKGEKVRLQHVGAQILCDSPAFLLSENSLYHFEPYVDAKKLKPFLDKNNIRIDRKIEKTYFRKFVGPLVAQFNVFGHGEGFNIVEEQATAKPILLLTESGGGKIAKDLFSQGQDDDVTSSKITFDLSFAYGDKTFRFDSFAANSYVNVEEKDDAWIFHKMKRDLAFEKQIIEKIKSLGQNLIHGRKALPKSEAFSWLQLNADALKEAGIDVKQAPDAKKEYFLGVSSIEVNIVENNDWFDIKTKVRFGSFELPILKLRELVLANIREFRLPDGKIAVIPEEWFIRYHELFTLSDLGDEDELILKKHHIAMVQNLDEDGLANTVIGRKLENLQHFDEIKSYDVPKEFQGELRPYQKAGYDWLCFLRDFNLGGCLADDMGLGKTVMTLAFLQSLKSDGVKHPTLLVMPTSLLYNWQKEAERFTPELKVLVHSGTLRTKDTGHFGEYDLILTSYGVLRLDIDFIEKFRFEYVILDESQAIKNPASNISKAVRLLNCKNRLILTGTPLENNTMDLWSQMTFVNPGLLGSQSYFKDKYQQPIEKKQDEAATKRLYSKIKPFMLRRHKSQVATELPEKIDSVQYCDMSEQQEKVYEETKAYYRNLILDHIEQQGINKSQLVVLQGLTKLRQIANNPLMVDEEYEGDSGKDSDVIHKLKSVIEGGSKVLVFSQFVKHLNIIRKYLDKHKICHSYLDGGTKDRKKEVEKFQENPDIKVFLISLKAGGVGLNLTAAEYVFLLDPWWNPAIEAQAVDRAHRIGQKNTVFTYKFISRNTVEEKILTLQRAKRKLFDELITTEETFSKSLDQEDIMSLLD